MNRRRTRGAWGATAVVGVASVGAVVPLLVAVVVAFTSPGQFAQRGVSLPDPWTLENFGQILADPRTLLVPAAVTLSVIVLLCTVQTFSSVLAAYVFARFDSPASRTLFVAYLALWLMPPVATVLPLYVGFARIGLAGTFIALVLPFALASPYAIFLLRQWFASLPPSLFDAATIDGASPWTTLWRVVLPLSRPAVATVVLVIAVTAWNSYLWPRLAAGVTLPQVQVAIAGLQTQYNANWTIVLAASTLALAPPVALTLALQRPLLHTIELTPEE